ncbi:MAG TPA: plastocyanin/azurin family copper-binding protein [Actinomycetota bacterium]
MRRFKRGTIAKAVVASVVTAAMLSAPATAAPPIPRGSSPADTHVEVLDFRFDESHLSIGRGGTVIFDFVGQSHHTATDGTGMDLFDSGSVAPGGPSTSFTFVAAGAYRFVCTPHVSDGMVGRISVPMRVAPARAGVHHTFTATWAAITAASGFVYDVQVKRPGTGWASWRKATTDRQASFTPNAGKGTYRFRSRMRSLTGGEASWSEVSTIRVG